MVMGKRIRCFDDRTVLYNHEMYRVQIYREPLVWGNVEYTVTISKKEQILNIFPWYRECFEYRNGLQSNRLPDYSIMMRDAFRSYQTQLDQKAKYEAMVKAAKNLPPITTEDVMKED